MSSKNLKLTSTWQDLLIQDEFNIPCNVSEPKSVKDSVFKYEQFIQVLNSNRICVDMQYPKLEMHNAEKKCLVRIEVYERLYKASNLLPDGYKLKIWDAWRPFALQKELYENYYDTIVKQFKLENWTKKDKDDFVKKFVSKPNEDEYVPPVHTTGGAVDVTIVDPNGKDLNMGTEFDAFTANTWTAYYEHKDINIDILLNRRLLYYIMTNAGFTNLPSEWWHYDYGDRFWTYYTNKPTIFKGAFSINWLDIKDN